MPDDRTFITELTTALGMLGGTDALEAVTSRPRALRLSDDHWTKLTRLIEEGKNSAEVEAAFENGRAFLHSPDALRQRRPILIEWTGGRRPPGDEVAPIDLRIDHVFLVSCKYLSANIANPSPGRLFEGLLATSGEWGRGDWYMETAPKELVELYLECRSWAGLFDLPDDPTELDLADRKRLRQALPPRGLSAASSRFLPISLHRGQRRICEEMDRCDRPLREPRAGALAAAADRECAVLPARRRLQEVAPAAHLEPLGLAPGVQVPRASRSRLPAPASHRSIRSPLTKTAPPDRRGEVRGHVEVRWSHGRFVHPPEAKIYLDTPTDELPGYHQLPGRTPSAGRYCADRRPTSTVRRSWRSTVNRCPDSQCSDS